ncbi:unnamed protein product [Darwinula stevensoni]|uniref:nucleoside diphosphate phosphatase n=1 Tax=Darwinula stevensoni TaxID=69355 RepID=A0A7R9FNC9_9CRUS|nr:unnamed protein product [Darwinula stevensoni]CAG0896263.1 unnamed protein product [Darwinula stevensoni]
MGQWCHQDDIAKLDKLIVIPDHLQYYLGCQLGTKVPDQRPEVLHICSMTKLIGTTFWPESWHMMKPGVILTMKVRRMLRGHLDNAIVKASNTGERAKLKKQGSSRSTFSVRFVTLRAALCIAGTASFYVLFMVLLHTLGPESTRKHAADTLDSLSYKLSLQKRFHAVIMDAGSTGSRVLAFTFHRSLMDGTLKIDDELFGEVKPGLSSYADAPAKGAESLQQLLEMANSVIPEPERHKTPLVLKATAGLRLLPSEKAENLLNEVRDLFYKSGYQVSKNSVSIMDGMDEGIYSWFTINFLRSLLDESIDETVAALDLGGGSTQITFVPQDAEVFADVPQDFVVSLNALNKELKFYTYSYLGLGLMAARAEIFKANLTEDNLVRSPCISPIVKQDWEYGGVSYKLMGLQKPKYKKFRVLATGKMDENRPIADFYQCIQIASNLVLKKVHKPPELSKRKINAISYFYDRAVESGLIHPVDGGEVTVKDYFKAAETACEEANVDQPFQCIDLTYISALLHYGYGLQLSVPLELRKKIEGHETSWALGAAYHILNS